jgi:subtilase family serine protease
LPIVIAVLILAPSFLAVSNGGVVPTASASQPSLEGIKPLSGYKSVGAADPGMQVTVSVAIPLRNLPELESLVKQVSDPASESYRQFLSSGQVAQMFLPTSTSQRVLSYLTGNGFSVQFTALDSTIVATGSVAQVKQYLGLDTQVYSNGTYSYYTAYGATTLPGAYAYASNSTFLFTRPDYVKSASVNYGLSPAGNVTFTEGGQSTKLLQSVYNATSLYSRGITGKGYTIGLLDFYGSPTVASDLAQYDSTYGFPPPPNFTIVPLDKYNPNLGARVGWSGEIALDVEVSHAMAPGANVVLYAANGALPLSAVIAAVVQDGRANVVSQSFGIPEWEYQEAGPLPFLFNSVFSDYYYMLGSVEGISFLSASGDAGGSGNSAGPIGATQYPSSSPYVTSVGATTTYVSGTSSGGLSFNQTAWSNLASVPLLQNVGGSGGGISIIEPRPWYQSSLQVPAGYPVGRMTPDIALDGSGSPGTFIVAGGETGASGGTSESAPLLAGLLTLVMQYDKGSLGLVNPSLYQLGSSPTTYSKAYTPITFGYNIPWVAKSGYNLVTGWGAPNMGGLVGLYGSTSSATSLSIAVNIPPSKGYGNVSEFFSGQNINLLATVTQKGAPVTSGSFQASLQTLTGTTSPVTLLYSASAGGWTGSLPVGNEAGMAYVNVAGSSGTTSGSGFAQTFLGYLANFAQPLSPYPWSTISPGLDTVVEISDLAGNFPPFDNASVLVDSYSIGSNTYTQVGKLSLARASEGEFAGTLVGDYPPGPMALVMSGQVYGYLAMINGIDLQGSDIYPQVVTEPGVVAPGQSLTIVANMIAPENIYNDISLATGDTMGNTIPGGANVTASLVSPTGATLATVPLLEHNCTEALRVCANSALLTFGYMTVPTTAPAGLYTVTLNAAYNDETSGNIYTGSFYGQIYVSAGYSVPKISVSPSTLFEGQQSQVQASITYPNGKEVTQGMYTAVIYPTTSESQYTEVMHSQYAAFQLIRLGFDPALNLWTANVLLPSPYNSSVLSSINGNSAYYAGPYDVYVTGLSADGVPTTANQAAQKDFFVQPYVYTANEAMTNPQQTSGLALSNVTIGGGAVSLAGDYFSGTNTIQATNVTISSSQVAGTLDLVNTHATLIGVSGGNIVSKNSEIKLVRSDLSSIQLTGSTVNLDAASTYQAVSPALPVVAITSPVANKNYTGSVTVQASVTGSNITSVSVLLDGKALAPGTTGAPSASLSYPVDTSPLPDGTHTISVVAAQSDGLSSSSSVSFATNNQLVTVQGNLKTANSNIATLQGGLRAANGTITSLQGSVTTLQGGLRAANGTISTLKGGLASANNTIASLTTTVYALAGIAVVAVILGAVGIYSARKQSKPAPTGPQ